MFTNHFRMSFGCSDCSYSWDCISTSLPIAILVFRARKDLKILSKYWQSDGGLNDSSRISTNNSVYYYYFHHRNWYTNPSHLHSFYNVLHCCTWSPLVQMGLDTYFHGTAPPHISLYCTTIWKPIMWDDTVMDRLVVIVWCWTCTLF